MGKEVVDVQGLIASLMEKDCLSIEREYSLQDQGFVPVFSFDALFKKLGKYLSAVDSKKRELHQERTIQELAEKELQKEQQKVASKPKDIFTVFEEEFGRLLSNSARA